MNVAPSKKAKLFIDTQSVETFKNGADFFIRLASASEVDFVSDYHDDGAVTIITADAKIYIPMDELVDFKAELERLNKEKAAVQKDIDFINNKLNNPNFVSKAPAALVDEQREKLAKQLDKMKMIDEAISKIENK
jgi:valyl-tRNA synthetase